MLLQKFTHKSLCVISLVFLLIFVNDHLAPIGVEAQKTQWSVPQRIPGNDLDAWPPILIADQNRTVHAFSSQWVGDEDGESYRAVVYNRWTLAQGWTIPMDIILSPYREARLTDVHLDGNDILHVVFFGGDNTGADIYYSKAPAATADNAYAWSTPIIIGEKAGDPEGAVFVEDDQGTLHVIYNGRQLGNGLYTVNSGDTGETWSEPDPIFFSTIDEPNISQLHAIKGRSGWLHAIWGVFNIEGQGRGIYYARSKDGKDWSEPLLVADAKEGLGTGSPTIFEYQDALMAFYQSDIKINMRRSKDNGQTWDDPAVIFSRHTGGNGAPSLVIDSNNDLHLFFGQRISGSSGSPDIHGMWHSIYLNNRWLEPDAIVKRPLIQDKVYHKGFDPVAAQAIVSQGNTILVTWATDPNAGPNGVWYSYKKLDTPELPVASLHTLENSNNPDAVNDFPIESTPMTTLSTVTNRENNPAIQVPTDRPIFHSTPSLPIFIGLISVGILIFAVVIAHGYRGK